MGKKNVKYNWPLTIILIVIAVILIGFPLYMTLSISVKTPDQLASPLALPTSIHWQNFVDAFQKTNYLKTFLNTFIITAGTLILTIITNSLVAYIISRNNKKRFFKIAYFYFISAMFIPFNVIVLPLVKQTSAMHLDNLPGMVILYTVFGLALHTFLYMGYIKTIPVELDEAAYIDGATPMQVFFNVVFPAMKPINATVAILTLFTTWNDFLMPLVILDNPESQTLQLAQYVFQGQFSTNYGLAFASYILVLLPILVIYFIFQKQIIAGVASGSVKG